MRLTTMPPRGYAFNPTSPTMPVFGDIVGPIGISVPAAKDQNPNIQTHFQLVGDDDRTVWVKIRQSLTRGVFNVRIDNYCTRKRYKNAETKKPGSLLSGDIRHRSFDKSGNPTQGKFALTERDLNHISTYFDSDKLLTDIPTAIRAHRIICAQNRRNQRANTADARLTTPVYTSTPPVGKPIRRLKTIPERQADRQFGRLNYLECLNTLQAAVSRTGDTRLVDSFTQSWPSTVSPRKRNDKKQAVYIPKYTPKPLSK
jgi:hypothetical protein